MNRFKIYLFCTLVFMICAGAAQYSRAQGGGVNGVIFNPLFLLYIGDTDELATGSYQKATVNPVDFTELDGKPNYGQVISEGFLGSCDQCSSYRSAPMSFLPDSSQPWQNTTGWQAPRSYHFQADFVHPLGIDLGSLDIQIMFIAGGSFNLKGKYVGQVRVSPSQIQVRYKSELQFQAVILEVSNLGTPEDPIVGVRLKVNTKFTNSYLFLEQIKEREFFIDGNGNFKVLH